MALEFDNKVIILKKIFSNPDEYLNKYIHIGGWIRNVRKQTDCSFIKLYDGTTQNEIQLVFFKDTEGFEKIKKDGCAGATLQCYGKFTKSIAQGQDYEFVDIKIEYFGTIKDRFSYVPCSKSANMETLRPYSHLRAMLPVYRAIYRIRSKLHRAVEDFFDSNDVLRLDPNIITTSDCEGAGEVFSITTLLKDCDNKSNIKTDFKKDFFKKKSFLTVSSQLQLESLCKGMGAVWTMNPSFRAEKSKSNRHLACFTHLEWELPFIELQDLMDFSESLVRFCVSYVLENCQNDLKFLDDKCSKGLIDKLKSSLTHDYKRISYTEAIEILSTQKKNILAKYKDESGFIDFELPEWGEDLNSYCERFLCEEIFKKPVFVYNYPKSFKSFYMKQNVDEESGKETVQGCDLLMPKLGELIGSSIREDDYDKLVSVMKEKGVSQEPLKWYLDLRRNGTFKHGGAGLGFDRLVSYCCLMAGNIRDVVPFPVSYQECFY